MKTLIVGAGALGGLIAVRLLSSGRMVWLATRDATSAAKLRQSGLQLTTIEGNNLSARIETVASLADYGGLQAHFDLIILATKAGEALEIAPSLLERLDTRGVLLPLQNGDISRILSERLGDHRVLGGLSNLGATRLRSGVYQQRNRGHLLFGELAGGMSERVRAVHAWMSPALEVKITSNVQGAVWSKLLLNCSVTTLGAIAGCTMREYLGTDAGRKLFDQTYSEALSVALTCGARPERMLVDPLPPGWQGRVAPGPAHDAWLQQVLDAYGDLKASMLGDLEAGRPTEIDFLNGYIVDQGKRRGLGTPANTAIVELVRKISRGELTPSPLLFELILTETISTGLSMDNSKEDN